MKTGFRELDKLINLDEPKLIILGGRPGMGKTTLALNIASNIADKQKMPVAIFDLELSKETIINRYKELDNDIVFINDEAGIEVQEICNIVRKLKQERDVKLVIIDYLQLIGFDYSIECLSSYEKNTKCVKYLKELSNELNITILVISMLSRTCEERINKRPILSDIGKSPYMIGSEEDRLKYIDVVGFLYEENANITELIIAKNTNGTEETIKLNFNEKLLKFEDIN